MFLLCHHMRVTSNNSASLVSRMELTICMQICYFKKYCKTCQCNLPNEYTDGTLWFSYCTVSDMESTLAPPPPPHTHTLDSSTQTDIILLYFAKAFDKVAR